MSDQEFAHQSSELCGIAGEDEETVTKGEFNRFVRVVNYYHGRPIKTELRELKDVVAKTNEIMQKHVESDELFFAKLAGAKWALYAIAAVLAPIVPMLYYLIRALTSAGVL